MRKSLFAGVLLQVLFPNLISAQDKVRSYANQLEKKFNIQIIYEKKVTDTWNGSRYDLPDNKKLLLNYLKIIDQEFSKYPAGYFQLALADILILTQNYHFQENHQAAMPDPYGRRLYLAIDGHKNNYSTEYLSSVIHHELQHNTEYAIWSSQYYKWDAWQNANTENFKYGPGGISAYSDLNVDWGSRSNPLPGFISLYSTLGQEEDRAEIMSMLMYNKAEADLHAFCRKDPILKKKIQLLSSKIEELVESSGFWRTANQPCYTNE